MSNLTVKHFEYRSILTADKSKLKKARQFRQNNTANNNFTVAAS